MEVAEQRIKELQPRKKKTSQNPPTMYTTIVAITPGEKLIIGKAMLSGNERSPKEYKWTPPTIIAPIVPLTKMAWLIGSKIEQQFSNMNLEPS